MRTKKVYIGLGSNLGDKLEFCLNAIELVDRIPGCSVEDRSPFFRTEPVGVKDHDWYVNGVISLRTEISGKKYSEKPPGHRGGYWEDRERGNGIRGA